MESLQDYAYNIYATNLSVSEKRKLIKQLEKGIAIKSLFLRL